MLSGHTGHVDEGLGRVFSDDTLQEFGLVFPEKARHLRIRKERRLTACLLLIFQSSSQTTFCVQQRIMSEIALPYAPPFVCYTMKINQSQPE
jgi:hypothetical protein